MVTHTGARGLRSALTACTALAATLVLGFTVACDKVPLTAPSGSVITLFAANSTVPLNGEIEIVATVIENGTTSTSTPPATGGTPPTGTATSTSPGAGTPVQNGTLVSFTTTLGTIEPNEAKTVNGQVRVKFKASGQSGTATITAFSGGASGKLENLKVGTAAAERVLISASPQTLSPSGGTAIITARVEDASGSALAGVPVTFVTEAGTLSPTSATTDQNGVATTTLNTTSEAKVTANVAGKTADVTVRLNLRTGVTITGPEASISAGLPVSFKVGVGDKTNIRDVTVDFGDGRQQSLGALTGSTTVSHPYAEPGTYTARAVATDATGFSESVATSVTVLPAQPPGVIIAASNPRPNVNQIITLTATVSGATSTIQAYQWDFGDGTTATTTSPQITKSYATTGTKVVTVTVVQSIGPFGRGQTTVDVQP